MLLLFAIVAVAFAVVLFCSKVLLNQSTQRKQIGLFFCGGKLVITRPIFNTAVVAFDPLLFRSGSPTVNRLGRAATRQTTVTLAESSWGLLSGSPEYMVRQRGYDMI